MPHHLLLVTVDHTPDSTMLGEEGREEYGRYKKALMAFFEKRNLDVVFYETHFRAHHMNVQVWLSIADGFCIS